jgi:hypothetical protein
MFSDPSIVQPFTEVLKLDVLRFGLNYCLAVCFYAVGLHTYCIDGVSMLSFVLRLWPFVADYSLLYSSNWEYQGA